MDLIAILRLLLRHRKLLALGLVLAVASGLAMERRVGESTFSGTAVGRILIGPSDAQAVNRDAVPTEATVLRTKLLADALSADAQRTRIAREAGIPPGRLVVKGPATLIPFVNVPLPERATEVGAVAGVPYVLTAEAADLNPILTLTGGATDSQTASAVVAAASAEVSRLIAEGSNDSNKLAVQPLGPIVTRTIAQHPSHALALAAPLALFVFWCSGIVIVAGLLRRRRPDPEDTGSPAGLLAFLQ